jgi:hypothetical protein
MAMKTIQTLFVSETLRQFHCHRTRRALSIFSFLMVGFILSQKGRYWG